MRSRRQGVFPAPFTDNSAESPAAVSAADQVKRALEVVLGEVSGVIGAARDSSGDTGGAAIARETVRHCQGLLSTPPTFLVSGRMKAGKSTLINALVRQRIAETAILECTDATTVYVNGAPERIEDVFLPQKHGAESTLESALSSAEKHQRRLAKVHYLPSSALARASYIDTPGLGTIDESNREVIDDLQKLARQPWSREGVGIDGVIYVFDSALRADEREHLSSLGFLPLTSVGVLSRADDYAAGAFGEEDPIMAARERADVLSKEYSRVFSSVVAVSGLLAESVETGIITEKLAAELGDLKGLDRDVLMHELETDSPAVLDVAGRENLLRALGSYGVLNGRDAASGGAVALKDFLSDVCGSARLIDNLDNDVDFAVLLGRAGQVHEKLRQLSLSTDDPRILDYWDEFIPASVRLAVQLYSLMRQAPNARVSTDSLALAERVLKCVGWRLTAAQLPGGDVALSVAEIEGLAEIDALASEKLLHLVSPLEEKTLAAVRSLVGVLTT